LTKLQQPAIQQLTFLAHSVECLV